jgi:hypothetical protein
MRVVCVAFGLLSLGLGIVGIFVPLLPTTPFLLLSAWLLSRGSSRLHRWMMEHPRFGPPVRAWQEHRRIPLHAKLIATGLLSFSAVWILVVSGLSGAAKAALVVPLAAVAGWIWTRRGRRCGEPPTSSAR